MIHSHVRSSQAGAHLHLGSTPVNLVLFYRDGKLVTRTGSEGLEAIALRVDLSGIERQTLQVATSAARNALDKSALISDNAVGFYQHRTREGSTRRRGALLKAEFSAAGIALELAPETLGFPVSPEVQAALNGSEFVAIELTEGLTGNNEAERAAETCRTTIFTPNAKPLIL